MEFYFLGNEPMQKVGKDQIDIDKVKMTCTRINFIHRIIKLVNRRTGSMN